MLGERDVGFFFPSLFLLFLFSFSFLRSFGDCYLGGGVSVLFLFFPPSSLESC